MGGEENSLDSLRQNSICPARARPIIIERDYITEVVSYGVMIKRLS